MIGVAAYLQDECSTDAIDWYTRVFGAKETRVRLVAPDGTCMNAEIEIAGSRVMLAEKMPSIASSSPSHSERRLLILPFTTSGCSPGAAESARYSSTFVIGGMALLRLMRCVANVDRTDSGQ